MAVKKAVTPKFHAKLSAPKQWKKRCPCAKQVYDAILTYGLDLHAQELFHPKMPTITTKHMETIVHNIGRLVADEITLKCSPKCSCTKSISKK